MKYLNWKGEKITDFSESNINNLYDKGFVFTRIEKGIMHQTRSMRINLSEFELTSENRRILKKNENIKIEAVPLPYSDYHWSVGKIAKDFYESRNANFSANKIKEITTSKESNFNLLLKYENIGFAICYTNKNILHYSYPFYDIKKGDKDMGLGMMIKAIEWARSLGKKYIYLGSLQRPTDTYKLQFNGIEWFDGEKWKKDMGEIKEILREIKLC
ncbi:MAG TPA: hypothetical protein VJC02_01140 [Candidatus Paceibacterota bacterium]